MVPTMWCFMQAFALMPTQPRRLFAPVAQALSEETVRAIAQSQGSVRSVAAKHHVSHTTVVRIRNCENLLAAKRPNWVRVSDDTVEEIRIRHEEAGWSYGQLAAFYGLPKTTIQSFCKYRRR